MSVSKWRYDPVVCDGRPCISECDFCNYEGQEQIKLYEMLPETEAKKYRPIKSTDWKWTFADYPEEKNGVKVFSCFACGGGSTSRYAMI